MSSDNSYLSEIIRALEILGGTGSLKEINRIIESNRTMPYINTNPKWKDNVRATIQRHCKDTLSYRGAKDIFYSVYGLREGYWGLNSYKSTLTQSLITPIEQRQIDIVSNSNDLSQTEKETIILSRIGQGVFRKRIIEKYQACIITGINDKRLLIASHIKPWRSATNVERLSAENGFLLSPLFDKLFDLGLITFKINGCLAVSTKVSNTDKAIINIDESHKYLNNISNELKANLEYHNDIIFIR